MTRFLLIAAALVLTAGAAGAAPPCKDANGKFIKCPAVAKATTPAKPAQPAKPAIAAKTPTPAKKPTTSSGPMVCKKGKPCGNACIATTQVCHK